MPEPLVFGPFTIDRAALELQRAGQRVALAPQAVRALIVLADRRGELVTRRELYDALWPGDTDVDVDRGLNTVIRQIRRAIGDSADAPAFLQTYSGRGYRLRATDPGPGAIAIDGRADHASDGTKLGTRLGTRRGSQWSRRRATFTAAALVLAAVVAVATGVVNARSGVGASARDRAASTLPDAAREAYLLGRRLLEAPDGARRATAVTLLAGVVQQAPDYAPAHAYLAHALLWAGRWDDAAAAAGNAFALDSTVSRAWLVASMIALVRDWDWARAEAMLQRAIALDSGDAELHAALGFVLATAGRHDSATAALDRARALDPVSAITVADIGQVYLYAGRAGDAADACARANALAEAPAFALDCMLDATLALGDSAAARAVAARMVAAENGDTTRVFGGARGSHGDALERFNRWAAERASAGLQAGAYSAFGAALAFSRAHRATDAVDALTLASLERGPGFVTATVDPALASLRADTAYRRLVAPLVRGGASRPGSGPGA